MELKVNGRRVETKQGVALLEVLERHQVGRDDTGVAVALNQAVVPRASWPETRLRDGDEIEIIRAVQGG